MSGGLRMGILGITGRMGRELTTALATPEYSSRFRLVASPKRGESLKTLLTADVVIEFSSPEAALELARLIQQEKTGLPLVVGATGWTQEQDAELAKLAKKTRILRASNFSLGVFICKQTVSLWAKRPELSSWQVSIREVHHQEKKDAPSGTALTLSDAIRENGPRDIPIESIREGAVFGIHEVTFETPHEKIVLIHEAKSRTVFATGAIDAAEKLFEKSHKKSLPNRLLDLSDLYSE